MLTKILTAIALIVVATSSLACPGFDASEELSSSALAVELGSLVVSQDEGRRAVASLGTIRNPTDTCFQEVVVEVKYFDQAHSLIDTIVQPLYGVVISARDDVAFRVFDAAVMPKEAYASQEARVLSSEPRYSVRQSGRSGPSKLVEVLVGWSPMALFVGVLIYFLRRMRRPDSPQERSLALMQKQIDLSQASSQSMERIAAALEDILAGRRNG